MRWVFYSLLVVNLAYLGWQLATDPVKSKSVPLLLANQDDLKKAPTLQLLSEVPQSQWASAGTKPVQAGICTVVGPWSAQDGAERARIQLAATGLSARIRAVTVSKDRLNWVYLPAYDSREQALEVLGELQSKKVDSFVIKTGDDVNAISLGYFTSADSAEGLKVKLHSAGYPAAVRETSQRVTEYWLYLSEDVFDATALDDFLIGNPSRERRRAACAPGSS